MRLRATAAIAASFSLVACGGGSGGGVASLPPPVAAPPSSPPAGPINPAPSTSPIAIFQPVPAGSVTYSTVGYLNNGTPNPVEESRLPLVYDAPSNSYIGRWNPNSASFRLDGNPQADSARFIALAEGGAILRPGPTNPEITLTYSSLLALPLENPWNYGISAFVAFGAATPQGSVPTSGSASYNGVAYGESLSTTYGVRGSVLLNFNFAAGSLAGHFDPVLTQTGAADLALARQTFANTVFAQGSQTFSGAFAGSTGSSFDGRFTGPAAQELIARFRQPYGADTLVGAWVGKR